jgi:hypothetical protein
MHQEVSRMGRTKRKGTSGKCQQCGYLVDVGAAYCSQCGFALGGRKSEEKSAGKGQPSYLVIFGVIAVIILAGVIFKTMFFSRSEKFEKRQTYQEFPTTNELIEKQVLQVASNFKCACGGCGELPLVECTCDMPRGALEEKAFIRQELMAGHSVEQVIQLVEGKYGLRIGS